MAASSAPGLSDGRGDSGALPAPSAPGAPPERPRVLADGWYGWLVPGFRALSDLYERWPTRLQAWMLRFGALRAAVLFLASTRYDAVATIRTDRGWRSLLLLRALLGRRRKLIALHFIDHPPRPAGLGGLLDRAWRPLDRWATRRALLGAQVLSAWELEPSAARFGLEPERFAYIPYAWRLTPPGAPGPALSAPRELVIASGRAFCDWPTLFAAARGAGWRLMVICGEHDRALVERLAAATEVEMACELPEARVRELLRQAAVSILPMREGGMSQGHVRLCDAVDAGAAIVASNTRSLEGYVEDGRTAVLVPLDDPAALRAAVDRLMADPAARERLARAAFERAGGWTWERYLAAIEDFGRRAATSGRNA